MSDIVAQLTPKYYRLRRIGIEQSNGTVVSVLDLAVLSETGREVGTDHPEAVLTAAEKQAIINYASRALREYEVATGLTKWAEPE